MGLKLTKKVLEGLTKYKDPDELFLYVTEDSWGMDSWQVYDPTLTIPKEILESEYKRKYLWNKPLSSLYLNNLHKYTKATMIILKPKKYKSKIAIDSESDIVILTGRGHKVLVDRNLYVSFLSLLAHIHPKTKLTVWICKTEQTTLSKISYTPILIRANQKIVGVLAGKSILKNTLIDITKSVVV